MWSVGDTIAYSLVLVSTSLVILANGNHNPLSHEHLGVVQWINSTEGGYIHPNQEYRIVAGKNDGTTAQATGMFATANIPQGRELAVLPSGLVIYSDDPEDEALMNCGTVESLAREMKLGNQSKYAPFVTFAKTIPLDNVPSTWSPMGQKLLNSIVGGSEFNPLIPPFDPTGWLKNDWYDRCEGSMNDTISSQAALLVVRWNVDGEIHPVISLYRKGNGKKANAEFSVTPTGDGVIKSKRDIAAGEEINFCVQCDLDDTTYGTAGKCSWA